MGCEMGRSLRGFPLVVASVIMAEALLLLGDCCEKNRHLNYSQSTSRFDRATAANTGSDR